MTPAGMRSIPLPSLLRFLAGAESLGADAGPAAVNRPLGFARSHDRRPGFDESPLGNPGPVDVHRNLSADTRQTFRFPVAAIQWAIRFTADICLTPPERCASAGGAGRSQQTPGSKPVPGSCRGEYRHDPLTHSHGQTVQDRPAVAVCWAMFQACLPASAAGHGHGSSGAPLAIVGLCSRTMRTYPAS